MSASEELLGAVLTELPSEVALDDEATIVYTNRTWRRFAEENGLAGDPASLRQSYLDVCDASDDSESALSIAESIADSHGWCVRATAGRDGGARFEVRL